jgi:two-component system, chemotaxis family, response regulator PixH
MSIKLLEKILIVENSLIKQELIRYYLSDSDYHILKATSAKQALEVALAEKPNVIITDVVMSEMNGFELCRLLRMNPITKNVLIVICTSKSQAIDRLCIRQGADIYLTRPYTKEQLLDAVQLVAIE